MKVLLQYCVQHNNDWVSTNSLHEICSTVIIYLLIYSHPYLSRIPDGFCIGIIHQEHVDEADEQVWGISGHGGRELDPLDEDDETEVDKDKREKDHLGNELANDVEWLTEIPSRNNEPISNALNRKFLRTDRQNALGNVAKENINVTHMWLNKLRITPAII